MDYVHEATTNVLSPARLPVEDLTNMLRYIEYELPAMVKLPISSGNTLHFYWHTSTYIY